jgi:hypothetical protein
MKKSKSRYLPVSGACNYTYISKMMQTSIASSLGQLVQLGTDAVKAARQAVK